jgi:acyl carrier protein
MDEQVKVRGYRIELGEIEAVLMQHPAVTEAVVIASEDETGHKRLVAYVVFSEEAVMTIGELHQYMKEKMPEYMAPSSFVVMDELPLTSNGKVNRTALPAQEQSSLELRADFMPARTEIERILTELWVEVLGVEPIGIHDNFFMLGGDSLLATRLVSKMRSILHVEIPLGIIFTAPTIAALAEHIEANSHPAQEDMEKISSLLEELEQLSEDELKVMVESYQLEGISND